MTTNITATPSFRFEITPLPDESMRGCAAIAQAAMPPSRGGLVMFALYAGVGVVAYLIARPTFPATFILGMVAVAATALSLQAEGRRRLRALRRKDTHELEPHVLELSSDGIRSACNHIEARYQWRDFIRAVENKEFYLFVRPSGTGAALPKRLLDPVTEASLRECIANWSPDRGAGLARFVR
jgi:hypothetical protein